MGLVNELLEALEPIVEALDEERMNCSGDVMHVVLDTNDVMELLGMVSSAKARLEQKALRKCHGEKN